MIRARLLEYSGQSAAAALSPRPGGGGSLAKASAPELGDSGHRINRGHAMHARGLLLGLLLIGTAAHAGERGAAVSPAEARKLMQAYGALPAEDQKKVRKHAGELRQMTPEERAWALQNQDAVRTLGDMPDEDRKALLDLYRQLPPEDQKALREAR